MNSSSSGPSGGGAATGALRRSAPLVVNAKPGDHLAVVRFLSSEYPHWSAGRLAASFDDPRYEPPDRLLIKIGPRPIGHAHTTRHSMQFGAIRLPVGELQCVLIAPECRRRGLGTRLLEAASRQMVAQGSHVALARTSVPTFFERLGWAVVGTDCRSTVGTGALLSEMYAQELIPKKQRKRPNVRLGRRVELESIERIYNRNLPGTFGPMERTGAVWRWIVDGGACEQFYVAATGAASVDVEDERSEIMAYAAVERGRILELLTAPGRRSAAVPMLARLCREAVENDVHELVFMAPATDHLHALFRLAGGRTDETAADGQVLMARVLSPAKLLRQIGPELFRRAEAASLPLPCEWSLSVDGRGYRVMLDARGATVTAGRHAEHRLDVTGSDLAAMVFGRFDWNAAPCGGGPTASSPWMEQAGPILFPALSLWCPPLDSLAALA